MGAVREGNLCAQLVAPGGLYDIIRDKRGNIGAALQIDLFEVNASLNRAAQVTSDGVHHGTATHCPMILEAHSRARRHLG